MSPKKWDSVTVDNRRDWKGQVVQDGCQKSLVEYNADPANGPGVRERDWIENERLTVTGSRK